MVATRLQSQPENLFTGAITHLQADLNELKTGVQFVEPKLYDLSTANTYDASGTFSISSTSQMAVELVITAQSTDSTPLTAVFNPVLYMDSTAAPYVDQLTSAYNIITNLQVSDDPTVVKYFINVFSRSNLSGSFWLKSYCYGTSPATMTVTRTV